MHNILLVEDNPADVCLFEEYLLDAEATTYNVCSTDSLEKAWYLKHVLWPDVVVVDLSLPDTYGEETLVSATEYFKDKPIVVLTGSDDLALAKKAVAVGIQNFLVKNEMNSHLLDRTIQCAIERFQLAQRDKMQQRSLLLHNEQLRWAISHRY